MTLNNWKYNVPLNSLFDRLFMRFLIVIIVITPFDLSNRLRSTFVPVCVRAFVCVFLSHWCSSAIVFQTYFFRSIKLFVTVSKYRPKSTCTRARQPWNFWHVLYRTANISSSYLISIVINNRRRRRRWRRRQCRWRWWRRRINERT